MRYLSLCIATITLLLFGCASQKPLDYSAFKQSAPRSILVLLPTNQSPDVNASYSVLAQVTYPLAESGYYVFPTALVNETFRQNGLTTAHDIQAVSLKKLHEIFAADAVLYMDIEEYGSSYRVITSETRVTVTGKLVDLKTGQPLWSGKATASSNENSASGSNGLVGLLIESVVHQVVDTLTERDYAVASVADARLLFAGRPNGMLYGPYSPHYKTDQK